MFSFRASARRAVWLGLATILLSSALGAPLPASAQDTQNDPNAPRPIVRDHRSDGGPIQREPSTPAPDAPPPIVRDHRAPVARLQVVIHRVKIHDDRDGALRGAGEMHLYATMIQCAQGDTFPCEATGPVGIVAMAEQSYSASSGQTVTLDRLVPRNGDDFRRENISEALGFPIVAEQRYVLRFWQAEQDTVSHQDMGRVLQPIDVKENGLGLGAHTARSVRDDGVTPGDYTITFEILRMALPDLQPSAFRVSAESPLPGGEDQVCYTVQNSGQLASSAYQESITIDGDRVYHNYDFGLAPGESRERCPDVKLPDSGSHQVAVTIDPERLVPEMDETNNVLQQVLVRTADPPSGPTPAPSPGPDSGPILIASQGKGKGDGQGQAQTQGQADLTVGGIKINGRVPDGKDDCKDGKSDVTVLVKNAGAGDAGGFAVRLVVDGAQGAALEQSVKGLEAGQEREVRFEDVRLKKGQHQLSAPVDADGKVAESDEENNELKVTAICKDGD